MSGHEGCGEDQSLLDYDRLIAAARAARDGNELVRIGGELERAGRYGLAWELLSEGGEIKRPPQLEPWRGPGSAGERLLVRRRIRHLGAELRNARFLACAARDVPKVIVATEARLIPLLRRSIPTIRFVDASEELAFGDADCETSYEGLACFYGRSEEEIGASFIPLRARRPDVFGGLGVAWHSSNGRKRLPSLADWASVLRSVEGRVQSLQYDEQQAGLRELENLAAREIGVSPIDQKRDVDGFAALVASVGGVLTISNTTAHMAGALGVPCVVVLDDLDHLSWPADEDRSPFYPRLRLIRQKGRPWPVVLKEGLQALQELANRQSEAKMPYVHQ